MSQKNWVWMPHAGHFICARWCQFHLTTAVGNGRWLVSTVGEYFPDEGTREILAKMCGIELEGRGDDRRHDYMKKIGYEEIGCDRKFETMVFPAKSGESADSCCPFVAAEWSEKDMRGYNDASEAYKGHLDLCLQWDAKLPNGALSAKAWRLGGTGFWKVECPRCESLIDAMDMVADAPIETDCPDCDTPFWVVKE